jgi:hypothetical protein
VGFGAGVEVGEGGERGEPTDVIGVGADEVLEDAFGAGGARSGGRAAGASGEGRNGWASIGWCAADGCGDAAE